ncbi:MAG: isoleucine--tRNA ligase [Microbacteriaceae bacterium]|nr:isoleucine--tRNA ligase [Microbacteriaceae bacterium]
MTYPKQSGNEPREPLTPSPKFPAIEKQILQFWGKDDTFRASVAQREGSPEWVFYDGPPFANGLPHYGHLLTGYAKDLFPRFQTMRGKQVHRRFGWDTHGLPAELEAERQLGLTDKSQIEEMGIAAFNRTARESVLKYTKEWEEYVTRMARWVDFENDYKTLDVTFMESVIWGFKQLFDKGLAYEGYRVLPYCWRDQTPLSNHELRMDDDVYKSRQDQTVTVTFPLIGETAARLDLEGVLALAWTTTPWTLPTNEALAVGPEIEYSVLAALDGSAKYLLATETIGSYFKELGYSDKAAALEAVSRTIKGSELAGLKYQRLWDFYADAEKYGTQNAWQILVADYVATGEGTGIVHQSPAYGEDDQIVCAEAGIPVVLSVDDGGKFLPEVEIVKGLQVFEANPILIKQLRSMGRLLKVASYEHSYPHCWRCRNPLIYKAVSSWFVKVPEFRDRMGELNQQINWVPENVKDGQFGKWLSNARDWSISRNRYWGSPIPIWKSDDPNFPRVEVYGSLEEIEKAFGRLPVNEQGEPDLHRPYIDDLVRPNPDDPSGKAMMRRITDVLDVWFDSGSMPFAQVHYPFENREWFDTHNPCDFIVEYIGQTRGWFYTLHVLATAIFDRPAFRNVLSHGIVLGNDGQKMSKSLRNYPDVNEVFDRDGADAMRWFLMSSSVIRGGNLVVTEEGIRSGVREFLLPLWSTYYFFALYANAAGGYEAHWRTDSDHELDRYLLAKTRQLIEGVSADLEALDAPMAADKLRDFADVLTNWYVRRTRDRFWAGDDKRAFDTLYTVLETLCRLAAPLAPLVTEEVWKSLTAGRSVHLEDWPDAQSFPADSALVEAMDRVRQLASAGLALRKATGKRVRLPLPKLTVVGQTESAVAFTGILEEELNLKSVVFAPLEEDSLASYGISRKLSVNARTLGPRIGKDVQRVIQASKAGDWSVAKQRVIAGGVELLDGEFDLVLEASDPDAAVSFLADGSFVVLDTHTNAELEAEGLARDIIRAVQESRRSAGLDVSDRIWLKLTFGSSDEAKALEAHSEMLSAETLATQVSFEVSDLDAAEIESLDSRGVSRENATEFRTLVSAGEYSNASPVLIEIARKGLND